MKLLSKLRSSRWDLAFIDNTLEDVISSSSLRFIELENPFKKDRWFADPFVLDVTDTEIYLLVEEMHKDVRKGRIAKLTIDKTTLKITKFEIILEEPWHLSFPFIIRKNEKIFVAPESANGKCWYLYELTTDTNGHDRLVRKATLCNDVVWDSIITTCFQQKPYMLTCARNDFYLDIYRWDDSCKIFRYSESIKSDRQNMRMAGGLFQVGDYVYCPSQVSRPGAYGEYVEIKRIAHLSKEDTWMTDKVLDLRPPHDWTSPLIDGLHTFNTYKGIIVVDIHRQNTFLSFLIKKLVMLKKNIGNSKNH